VPWGEVRGHDRVVAELRSSLAAGRFPHALLLVGPEGIGKRLFARRLAQALLCERRPESALEPCGSCPSCHQIVAGTHPDVLTLAKPEERHELPIDAIRRLCLDLGFKPMRGSRRVAIVDDADDLSEEAANAFLKTLEEPPPGAVLMLIGTSAERQLETLRSRCRVVRFDPLPKSEVAAILVETGVASDPEEASRLAALGEGSPGRAAGLADPALAAFRRELLSDLADPRGLNAPALARRLEAFVADAGKESAPKRERASLLIGEMARFYCAILEESLGLARPLPDPADRPSVVALAERIDPDAAIAAAERCLDADYQVSRRAHLPLIFDALLHDLARRTAVRT
jgi:DNA polymerase-3 subunit delta'